MHAVKSWDHRVKVTSAFCAVLLTLSGPKVFGAGPIEKLYALEEEMAEAHETFLISHERGGQDSAPTQSKVKTKPDERIAILKKIDTLADANLELEDGAQIAMSAFYWSWNLDLDLDKLWGRFDRIVQYHHGNPLIVDVLGQVPIVVGSLGHADRWTSALERLRSSTSVKKTKVLSSVALGQVFLDAKQMSRAKKAFQAASRLSEDKETVEMAKGFIFEIEHLQIGMPAPDFSGKTMKGKKLSLQSLQGKVVLVDFWASWCAPCIGETPHLIEAAEHFKGKPFEILGISLDDDKEMLKEVIASTQAPGLQLWNSKGWDTPARALYNVQTIPTWYLVDAQGIIRARDSFGKDLIPAIQKAFKPYKTTEARFGKYESAAKP